MRVVSLLFKRSSLGEVPGAAAELASEGVMKVSTVAVNVSLPNPGMRAEGLACPTGGPDAIRSRKICRGLIVSSSPGVPCAPVQMRDMREVEHRIRSETARASGSSTSTGSSQAGRQDSGSDAVGTSSGVLQPQAAGALLFVSGTHPIRRLPGVNRCVALMRSCVG